MTEDEMKDMVLYVTRDVFKIFAKYEAVIDQQKDVFYIITDTVINVLCNNVNLMFKPTTTLEKKLYYIDTISEQTKRLITESHLEKHKA